MKQKDFTILGKSIKRLDTDDKARGSVKYTDDVSVPGIYHAKLHTSKYAHAAIKSIDTSMAWEVPGVKAILTGKDFPHLVGPMLADRPILALDKVRYFGEPIAVVVADEIHHAKKAADLIKVDYKKLPVVNSPEDALQENAPLIHENLSNYKVQVEGVHAVPNSNIANLTKIRKGDFHKGFKESDVTVEADFSFSPSDHAALETRVARAEIAPAGRVTIYTSSQGPFYVKKLLSEFFHIDAGNIVVHTPMVGGAFGGKGTVQLEFIAYLASQAIGGGMVRIENSREEDLITSPCHIGLSAHVMLGATNGGELQAAKFNFKFDSGAYSDTGAGISKSAGADCTGPYRIANVWCDSHCVYTNHPYATSFRGFGHPELTFAMERAMDMLADKLNMDPLKIRLINAIKPGCTTPTQAYINASNVGDTAACLNKIKELIHWDKGKQTITADGLIRTKGLSAFWKTSSTPTNAGAGVVLTFNQDGSVNLNCAAVEVGQGTKTALGQILAEKLQMDINKIHVTIDVDTQYDPHQWKTVASSTTYLAGRAVIAAGEDVIKQLKNIGSVVLKCSPSDLDVANGQVFTKGSPEFAVKIKDVANGYKYPNGNTVGGLVIGEGSYIVRHLTPLDPQTGFGKAGPQWTVGAQAVEIEYNPKDCTYRVLNAVTVLDAGKVINWKNAIGQMHSGMYLGLSWAMSESFAINDEGIVLNPDLRSYSVLRSSDVPNFAADFIETPLVDGPYGARGIGEYGVIGMAPALANSLAKAAGIDLNHLPLTPELIWQTAKGGIQ